MCLDIRPVAFSFICAASTGSTLATQPGTRPRAWSTSCMTWPIRPWRFGTVCST